MTPLGWIAVGFLLGSITLGVLALWAYRTLCDDFADLQERLDEAEVRVADAERWAAVLGASLYGKSKDTD